LQIVNAFCSPKSEKSDKKKKLVHTVIDLHGKLVNKHKLCAILSAHPRLPLDRILRVQNWRQLLMSDLDGMDVEEILKKYPLKESSKPSGASTTPMEEERDSARVQSEADTDSAPEVMPTKKPRFFSGVERNASLYKVIKAIEHKSQQPTDSE
jgi:ribosomal protein L12E/L44/L45/RPP1/RPP2